ncbi:MAG: nitrogen regulation protein NR(II) [Gammaproteobacteria bacterium]|nr:nitrogen regulation protein NR(II) [Gammaproteobacteria bacterium]
MRDNFYSFIVDSQSTAILLLNKQCELEYMNPAAEATFSVSSTRAEGMAFSSMLADRDGDIFMRMQDSINKGHSWTEHECILRVFDSSEVTANLTINTVEMDDEEKVLVEIVILDRQLKILKESHLLKEHQATRSMLRGMAHEIKNPLGGLRGAAQLLESELENNELTEYTGIIIKEADRLHKLVDRMLGPNIVPNKIPHNIHEVLHHVYSLVSAEDKNIKFRIDYDPSIPMISFDRDLLVQAVLNITRNAIRAVDNKGEITFKTRVLRHYTINGIAHKLVACMSIIDNGPGIPEDISAKIFFPMVSGQTDGSGLGLAISQMLINQHHGLIKFKSEVGRTEFKVMLPIENGTQQHTEQEKENYE